MTEVEIGLMISVISWLGYLAWRPKGPLFHRERQVSPQPSGPITRGTLAGCKFGMALGALLILTGIVSAVVEAAFN